MKMDNLGSQPYLKRKYSQAHVFMKRTYSNQDSQDGAKEKKMFLLYRDMTI